MSIIYNCPEQRNPAQIRRCWTARNILAKYSTPVTDLSVNIQYDFATIAYLKKHPGNVARLEYPQIVVNNIVVGNVAELQAADDDGRLLQYIQSVPQEVQQAIALNASLLEESHKSHEVQREKEKKELEEKKRKLEAQIKLQEERLREEKEREEEKRKEREAKLAKKRQEKARLQSQRDLQISQISEKLSAVQQLEQSKSKQKREFATLVEDDEAAMRRLPQHLQDVVNQIHGVLPQLFKRTLIPICQKYKSFEEAIDFVFDNQSKLEAEQPQFPLLVTEEQAAPAVAANLLESSLLLSSMDEPSAAVDELTVRNVALESENERLKAELTKFKFQQLQFFMALRDETKEELKNLDKKLEKQLEEVEVTRGNINNLNKKLELLDAQVIELNSVIM